VENLVVGGRGVRIDLSRRTKRSNFATAGSSNTRAEAERTNWTVDAVVVRLPAARLEYPSAKVLFATCLAGSVPSSHFIMCKEMKSPSQEEVYSTHERWGVESIAVWV
jgi:hypothetical protein